jgi:hypothetical protein
MDPEGSVTRWISLLKNGDRAAAEALWRAYFHRLVALARTRLRGTARREADEGVPGGGRRERPGRASPTPG